MDLPNPKQTRPTPGSYLSDQTFVFTTRLIKRLPSLYCFYGWGFLREAGSNAGEEDSDEDEEEEGRFLIRVSTTICGHER